MTLNERIAIIDDDGNLRKTLSDILTHYGYVPLAYPNGQNAIQDIAREPVGVALLDLRLEDCSGLEVLRAIKEKSPDTACIILTGHASQDSAIEAVNAGAYSYFLKPVNIDQLLVTIRRALEKRQADFALVQSEHHYQALADASPVGIFRTNTQGHTTYVNPRWSVMSGVSTETAMGLEWLNAVHPDDRSRLADSWPDVLEARQASVAEYRFLRPDGSVAWVIGQSLPEYNTAGQFIGYIGTITDITARKQVEDALHRSEAQYRLLTDHIEDIVWQLDQNLHFIYVSPASEHVLGYTPEEVYQMVVTELLDEEGITRMGAVLQARLAQRTTGAVTPTEYRMKHKNGRWVAVEVVSSPVYNLEGQPVAFVGVTRDITERKRIEELLRLQSTALAATANAIVITDPRGIIEWVNPAFTTLTGYSLGEAVGKDPRILKSGHHEQSYYAHLWDTISTGNSWSGEIVNQRKDGSLYNEEMTITPLMDAHGHVTHYIAIKQDISERKQTEAAIKRHLGDLEVLYENGLKLTRLFEKQAIAQCIIDLLEQELQWHHAVLRVCNPGNDLLEMLGFSQTGLSEAKKAQERHRLRAIPFGPGTGLTGWAWQHNQVVRSGNLPEDARYLENFAGMQSGLYVPITVAERVLGLISVESEQPDAFSAADERLLVTLAAQAAAAFDNARLYAETVYHLEELDTLVQVSAAMRTAPGRAEMLPVILEQTEAILRATGAAIAFFQTDSGEIVFELGVGDLAEVTQHRMQTGQGITSWVIDHGELYVCQDVNSDPLYHSPVSLARPPRTMAFAPLISQSQVIGVLLVGSQNLIGSNQVNLLQTIANIAANAIHRAALFEQTVNYAAELEQRVEERTAELHRTNTALQSASRAKDEFLASMSHELRTPLTGILNLSEVLQEQFYGPLNEKQLHYVKTIEESGRHLHGLINDILDISKIEAGQFDLQIEICQVELICQSSLQLTKGLANKKKQQLSFTIAPPGIELLADARRLKQMLVNLLSNAVKFTPEGGKIGLEVTADEEAQVIHFSVWDTGVGIAEQDFERLFRPFSQLDASLTRQHEGTGLGLTIAQRLADLHGGGISLESTPGQGSRFTIHIPWVKHQPEPENALPKPKKTTLEKHASPADNPAKKRAPFRLLLADDNQVNVEIYAEYLRQHGYQVLLAGNGQEALDLVHQEQPHLILMDIQMPGMDGLSAIRQLRALKDAALARTPVIALTALAMPGDRERCLQAGANDYLGKPVSLRDLLRVIKMYLK